MNAHELAKPPRSLRPAKGQFRRDAASLAFGRPPSMISTWLGWQSSTFANRTPSKLSITKNRENGNTVWWTLSYPWDGRRTGF